MMQIIKLWLKISAFLAILGWITHAVNPDFAAWVDGLFHKPETTQISAPLMPDAADPVAPEPSVPAAPVYKFNE